MEDVTLALDVLEEAAQEAGAELRTNYSGRVMYGATCVGVVGDAGAGIRFVISLMRATAADSWTEDADRLELVLGQMRSDNMGRDMIYYWPALSVAV